MSAICLLLLSVLMQNPNTVQALPKRSIIQTDLPYQLWPETTVLEFVNEINLSAPPPLNPTGFDTFENGVRFLYSGERPVQFGVNPEDIKADRVAVLRGRCIDASGLGISDVKVQVLGQPEFGETFTDLSGLFDMAVNGGGRLNLVFSKPGYLPVQRRMRIPWNNFCQVPEVVLTPQDINANPIENNVAHYQSAQGSLCSDIDGDRRATVIFPPNTVATMDTPDGPVQPVSFTVRATEMTVGESGPQAMIADLPATTAYTYAVDLSLDEAIAAGASGTRFNQPVYLYVDNFIGFPTGAPMQNGFFNERRGEWEAQDNGRVIEILSISDGLAVLDVAGTGMPATPEELAALNISDGERAHLATLYSAPHKLWRCPLLHFSTFDTNPSGLNNGGFPPGSDPKGGKEDDPNCNCGSIIERQNQIFGESIPLAGLPFELNYRSDRAPGREADYAVTIALTGDSLPEEEMTQVELNVEIAGQAHFFSFDPETNLNYTFVWDGKDGYGRRVYGSQVATIRVTFVYPTTYVLSDDSFGSYPDGDSSISGEADRETSTYRMSRTFAATLGTWDARAVGLGGWTLSNHLAYDAAARTLYQGTGKRRQGLRENRVIQTVAGNGDDDYVGDGGPALAAELNEPWDVALHPDGTLYIADAWNAVVRKVDADGIITTVAGGGSDSFGDEIPATEKRFSFVGSIEFSPDGSYFVVDTHNGQIHQVGTDGIVRRIAGGGETRGEQVPALEANIGNPYKAFYAEDGSLYFSVPDENRIRRLTTCGLIETVAGSGNPDYRGDGGPALDADMFGPRDMVLDRSGNLFISDYGNDCIRMVTPGGLISTIAGTGVASFGDIPEGQPVSTINIDGPDQLWLGENDSLYYTDPWNHRIYEIDNQGILRTFAGIGDNNQSGFGFSGDNGLALDAELWVPSGMAFDSRNNIFFADTRNNRVRKIAPPLPYDPGNSVSVPSADGKLIYTFDEIGKHIQTRNALTGANRFSFTYDENGYLAEVLEFDEARRTTITRDGQQVLVTGPYGQTTTLTLDANDFLASVTDPLGHTYDLIHDEGGLLTSKIDPRGLTTLVTYDELGLLIREEHVGVGALTLARSEAQNTYTTTLTSAEGRIIEDEVRILDNGQKQLTTTWANGNRTTTTELNSARTLIALTTGQTVTLREKPDPRFGMLAPLRDITIDTPGALTFRRSHERSVTLADAGDLFSVTEQIDTLDINGRVYTYRYDAANSDWTITTPEGRQTVVDVDHQARAVGVSIPGLAPMTISYDAEGRMTGWSLSDGVETRSFSLTYSAEDGLLQQSVEPFGSVDFNRDARGEITQMTLPGSRAFALGRDQVGNVVSLSPPDTNAYEFDFNGMDQWTAVRDPSGERVGQTSQTYTYDSDSFLQQVQFAGGDTALMAYEAGKARKSSITLPNGSYTFTYDNLGVNPTGQLRTLTSPDGVMLTLTHEGFLPSSATWSGGVVGSVVKAYSQDFQLSRLTLDGVPYFYRYDQDGNLTQVGDLLLERDSSSGFLTGSSLQEGNGIVSDSWTMNAFGEYDAYAAQHNLSDELYQQTVGSRNQIGWINAVARTQQGVTQNHVYSYDVAGNLTQESVDGSNILAFTYDVAGNRYPASGTAVYNQQDQLLQWDDLVFSYTPEGALASKTDTQLSQTTTYVHDLLGNLKQVGLPAGDQLAYWVDGLNRRVAKRRNGVTELTYIYQDQLNPVMTVDSGGVKTRYIYAIHPHVPSFMVRGGALYRLVFDHVGSVRLVVKVDDGSVAQAKTYDALGRVLSDSNPGFQIFGFAGGIEDLDTGLVHFGRRDYDPTFGRFISKDPLHFKGGEYNLYAYARNNPVNFFDPGGTFTQGISNFLGRVTGATGHPSGGMTSVFKWEFSNTGKLVGGTMSSHNPQYGQTQCYKDQVTQNTKNLLGDLAQMGITELIDHTPWNWTMPNNPIKQGFNEVTNPIKDYATGVSESGSQTDAQAQQDHIEAFKDMLNFEQ